jgi:hypothetical protein
MTPSKEIYINDRPGRGRRRRARRGAPGRDGQHAGEGRDPGRETGEVVLGEVVRVLGLAKEAGASGFALASE